MAQDGPHDHRDGAAPDSGSAAPRAPVTYSLMSPGPNGGDNGGSLTGSPVDTADAAGKGKSAVVPDVRGEGERRGQADGDDDQSTKGKGPAGDAAVAAATGTANLDLFKGKGPAAAAAAAHGGATDGAGGSGVDKAHHLETERERRVKMKNMFNSLRELLPHVPEKTDKATIVGEAINYIRTLEIMAAKLEKRKMELILAKQQQQAAAMAAAAGASSSSSAFPAAASAHTAQGLAALTMSSAAGLQGWGRGPAPQQQRPQAPAAAAAPAPPPPTPTPAAGPGAVGFQTWSGSNVVLSVSNNDAHINVCAPRQAGLLTMAVAVLNKYGIEVVGAHVMSDSARAMFTLHARVNPASAAAAMAAAGAENMSAEDLYKLAVSEIMVWLGA